MCDHIQLIGPGGQRRSRLKRVPFADPVKMVIGRGLHESKAAMSRFDVRPYKGLHHLQIPLPVDRHKESNANQGRLSRSASTAALHFSSADHHGRFERTFEATLKLSLLCAESEIAPKQVCIAAGAQSTLNQV
jgi:hypothetical protein